MIAPLCLAPVVNPAARATFRGCGFFEGTSRGVKLLEPHKVSAKKESSHAFPANNRIGGHGRDRTCSLRRESCERATFRSWFRRRIPRRRLARRRLPWRLARRRLGSPWLGLGSGRCGGPCLRRTRGGAVL